MFCPLPTDDGDRILLAHGGGGRLTQQLIDRIFRPAFANGLPDAQHDGAVLPAPGAGLAFTTDSYVVQPLLFPGGTIGDLAVNGAVNDLAMCGARPLYLSAAFILEEGLPLATLRTVVESMSAAARAAGVSVVTGDTKVVEKGKGDGIFITTAGVGVVEAPSPVSPAAVQPGDAIVLSGDIGAHGVAILSVREGIEFESGIVSDTAPLWPKVRDLLAAGVEIHCLRDLTRGGLATSLNEIAATRAAAIRIREAAVPVRPAVRGACEILGLDPLYIANEGRFIAIVPGREAALASAAISGVVIGEVSETPAGMVTLETRIGGTRVLDLLSGEQLPRIC